ncbi:unnamed protein product [Candidula unifasciata]|uniref:C2H2-type domain-containing protein n=1 Tax=Candidula unifasciata TaxID=100452 RepID=A0A8S4A1J7_9EUPU|nr:unnamed protein product [Candidula unifasciata]
MDALADRSLQPAPQHPDRSLQPAPQHPVSPCGFYSKQDPASYYFSNSDPPKPGYGLYPAYPKPAEGNSWANSQKSVQYPFVRQPVKEESMQDERNEGSRAYITPPNSESNPHHLSVAAHQQIHQPQLQTSLPASSPYSHGGLPPVSREMNQKKYSEEKSSCDELSTFYDPHKLGSFQGSVRSINLPRSPEPLQNDNVNLTYDYKKQFISGRFADDNYRSLYYQHFRDAPQNKNTFINDNVSVISYNKSRATPLIPQEKQRDAGECETNTASTKLRDNADVITKHYHRDFDRKQNFAKTSDQILYRREMEHPENISKGKFVDYYNDRDKTSHSINKQPFFEKKIITTEDFSIALKNKQMDAVPHPVQKNVTPSLEDSQEVQMNHQYHTVASPHYVGQSHVAPDALKSPISQSSQADSLHESTLYGPTTVKSESLSSVSDHRFSREDPPSLSWMPSSSSPTPHYLNQTHKTSFNKDYDEQKQNSGDLKEVTGYKEPSQSDEQISRKKMLTRAVSPQLMDTSEERKSPTETPSKLSPSRRCSNEGFTKLNSSDSCEDGSLDAKREEFSDDGEDDSVCEESTPHSPGFSPFHDRSVAYPHHFTHPFFPSQTHGAISSLKFPFGSYQGHHDSTPGYPFRHMSGVPQDMALMGHMHSARPPFISSVGPGIEPLRQIAGEKDIYFCHLCSYSGKSKPEFDSHMNTHFEFNCPHCDYTSRTEGRLKRHVKDFHSDDSSRRSMPGRPKIYKCKQCQFLATDKDAFWAHSRTHIKEDKLLQCPQCPFVTEYKHHLEYHLRNHFGSKPFKCPKCNYSCVNKSMLNSHMKSHTNVYQYRCSDCTYATKYCHSLKLHLKKYNHKPATVLNQDGSLPQGLDVESSGLSIVSKRGPPRGPRGTRKDNTEPYLNHLFEMPQMPLGVAGMNSMLNGILPFWPMLPQMGLPGHPPQQSGMLPGIRNMVQQMGIRADHKDRSDSLKLDFLSDNENSKRNIADKAKICRLCGFVAETREALGFHFMQLHKEEAKEVAKSYGLSETFLNESFKKIIPESKPEQQEELQQSDSEEDGEDNNYRKLDTDFHQNENSQNMHHASGQVEESSKMTPASWSPVSSENYDGHSRPSDVYYSLKEVSDGQNGDDNRDVNTEIDILQQMTLKFGMGPLTDNKRSSANNEVQVQKKEILESVREPTNELPVRVCQTPLDLTKPKSVSPLMLDDSPRRFDINDHVDEEERMSNSDSEVFSHPHEVISNPYEVRNDKVQSEKLLKRLLRENDDSVSINSPSVSDTVIPPRKRSRKGKAYKLDTICLKLQRRQSSTSHEEENDECDTDIDGSFHDIKLNETNEENTENNTDRNYNCPTNENELSRKRRVNSPYNSAKQSQHDFEDAEMEEVTVHKSENEDNNEMKINIDLRPCGSINRAVEKSKQNEESDLLTENTRTVQEEAEIELQKLQRSLHVFKQSPLSDEPESTKDEIYVNNTGENTESKDDKNGEMVCENQPSLDNISDAATSNSQFPQKSSEGDKVDQVEMINTVIENRKKPVPPAVRRGTELAWKLLNDPVHPVTTLPLPVETLPSPQSSKTPSVSHSTVAFLPEINSSTAVRKDSKTHPMSPHYSQPLHLNVPQPRHPTTFHPHTSQSHYKNPSVYPQAPHIHHPHVQTSLMSMKPLMSIPLPSTPMAYIPPTNRMMPEPNTTSNSSRMKHVHKDLYECTYCDLSFRDCVMYTVHMGYHSNQNPFQCNSCGVVSRDKVEFFLHIARSPHV